MGSIMVSVHIPKCGGSSFNAVLAARYGPALWRNYGQAYSGCEVRPELIPPGTRCIHGHFRADTFDRLIDDPVLVTWLRHPVDRMVSAYHYLRRHPDMTDASCREMHERNLTLTEFADHPWNANGMARYLAGKPLAAFAFVGVVEQFDASLALFHDRFGGELHPVPAANVNPDRPADGYELSAAEYDFILARNRTDLELYTEATRLLDRARRTRRASPTASESHVAEGTGWMLPAFPF